MAFVIYAYCIVQLASHLRVRFVRKAPKMAECLKWSSESYKRKTPINFYFKNAQMNENSKL